MILVISGTNRPKSYSEKIAKYVVAYLKEIQDEKVEYFSLMDMPHDTISAFMYNEDGQSKRIGEIQDKYIVPSKSWIIISPEYNGSFSGILKLFIDAISVRKYDESFAFKNVALIGVASGRAGNLRGMDHLTGMLNYLKMHVYHEKLPISTVEDVTNISGEPIEQTKVEIDRLLNEFVNFISERVG